MNAEKLIVVSVYQSSLRLSLHTFLFELRDNRRYVTWHERLLFLLVSYLFVIKNAGFIYVSNTQSGMLESPRVKVTFKAEPKTPKPSASNITIKNNKGKSDTVIVKELKKSDVVKLYSSSGKYQSSKTSTSSTATITVKQLGKGSGSVYVTVTRPGMNESDKVKKTYKAE